MKKVLIFFLGIVIFNIHSSDSNQKTALVCGAGGFIGHHLIIRLKKEGYWVRGIDLKYPEFSTSLADEFFILDLRNYDQAVKAVFLNNKSFDELYQLAADMGGMGYIKTHDAQIMHNSALINLNILELSKINGINKIFFSSSACTYPECNQLDPLNPKCFEESVYPANPDTEYGWEKLFSERVYQAYAKDYNMDVRIARFHNIFGPQGTWNGGKEKAPAAICRKIAQACDGDTIEIWGKGDQTRSFLYIDECIEGIRKLMLLEKKNPPVINIGSEELISINNLVKTISHIAGKKIIIKNVPGPEGVRGRNSDNKLIKRILKWQPTLKLEYGLKELYPWIQEQVKKQK